jgi:hypothetical protein
MKGRCMNTTIKKSQSKWMKQSEALTRASDNMAQEAGKMDSMF